MRFSQNDENTTYAVFAPKASIVIKILQGSVVTQSVLSGLTVHPPVANFF